MSQLPETRSTLLLRIRDAADQQAWGEFTAIYEPVVYRLARRTGLQHADALDLCQDVLVAVAKAIDRWTPDRERGRFRTWLYRVAKNMALNALTRRSSRSQGRGGTTIQTLLHAQPSEPTPEQETQYHLEYRRATFQWAAEQVRGEFRPKTWEAFWLTSVENLPIETAAARLGLTVGAIYAARSRVMARIRKKVEEQTVE